VFDSLKSNGVEWDTIGISVYPYWAPEWNAEDDYRLGAFSRNMPTVIMDAFKEAASSAR
jgi:arabinogalactan endo-1,4-beta-galactosidase